MTVQLETNETCMICLEELPAESFISLKRLGSVTSVKKNISGNQKTSRTMFLYRQGQNEVVHFHHTKLILAKTINSTSKHSGGRLIIYSFS